MIRSLLILFLLLTLTHCGTSKQKKVGPKERKITVAAKKNIKTATPISSNTRKTIPSLTSTADNIIATALTFSNVRYKYGGTTKKGMDCSGLIYTSFKAHEITLPRVSAAMALEGKAVPLTKVIEGDLLFFNTDRKRKRINHVGLVVSTDKGIIKFIHATSSRGVIVSSIKEGFWNYAFVKAKRVL